MFYEIDLRKFNCIYLFIDLLKQIQTTTYIKIRGLDNSATVRRTEKEKLAFSLEQYRRLETGEKNRNKNIYTLL
jgi:hypothetical protein